jgi:hypothetical protein
MVLAHRVAGELCSALPPAGSCYDVCVCVWERASVRERERVCVYIHSSLLTLINVCVNVCLIDR